MRKKRRRTREEVRQVVREFKKSGLSPTEFAKEVRIQPQHLRRWILREDSERGNAGVVRVKLRSSRTDTSQATNDQRVEVVLRNGRVLRVPPDFERESLLRLLEILDVRC